VVETGDIDQDGGKQNKAAEKIGTGAPKSSRLRAKSGNRNPIEGKTVG
jgi:hypothetical protein